MSNNQLIPKPSDHIIIAGSQSITNSTIKNKIINDLMVHIQPLEIPTIDWRDLELFEKDGKWGYIKTDGSYLIEPKFDHAWSFEKGFASVKHDGKYGRIDTTGKFYPDK